jgi:hypothetical protein
LLSFTYISWICGSNQIAQIVGKPDLAPAAWVRRLVTLCDRAPATPFGDVQLMLEKELGQSIGEMFERFEMDPLGSASIAQVATHTHTHTHTQLTLPRREIFLSYSHHYLSKETINVPIRTADN